MDESEVGNSQPSLDDIPLFAALDSGVDEPDRHHPTRSAGHAVRLEKAESVFGVYQAGSLRANAAALPAGKVDWAQVVWLRKEASALISEESQNQLARTGVGLASDDRLLLGRSIIKRVVGDHVRSLHREGADLWSPAREQAYVQAVEDAVFGYGRLQSLLELPSVENIEIHGCNFLKMVLPV